jgi:glyoxylase-like metal-dependent hydrolase (beta-lactamase superfamily II)
VEYETARDGPTSVTWRGRKAGVIEIVRAWQDYSVPAYAGHARGWLHRRHRNCYLLRLEGGSVVEIYLDRAGGRREWLLLKEHALALDALSLGPWPTNCYILRCAGEAIVVDPADDVEKILAALGTDSVRSIVLTHGHRDHVQALGELRQRTGAPVCIHQDDAAEFGLTADRALADGDTLTVGFLPIEIVHTPGHTPGSVCLRFDQRALVGDTLFPGGPGHTTSPEALATLVGSLERRVFAWPDGFRFYPGHGEGATIGEIRPAFNRFLARTRLPDLCGDVTWD